MLNKKELQHIFTAIIGTLFIISFSWLLSGMPNLSENLFGNGYWYYTSLQYFNATPLLINSLFLLVIVTSSGLVSAFISRASDNLLISPILGIIYALNPWLIHGSESVSLVLGYLIWIPLIGAALFILGGFKQQFPVAVIFTALAVLTQPYLLIPILIFFGAYHILSEEANRWKFEKYMVLIFVILAAAVLNRVFGSPLGAGLALSEFTHSGFDIGTWGNAFPHYLYSLLPFAGDILPSELRPNMPVGLFGFLIIVLGFFRKKIDKKVITLFAVSVGVLLLSLGPILQVNHVVRPRIILPYAILNQLLFFIDHVPATLVFLSFLLGLLVLALATNWLIKNQRFLYLVLTPVLLTFLLIQVVSLPFPVSATYSYAGYDSIIPSSGKIALLEFDDFEKSKFDFYRERRYRDHGQIGVSTKSETGMKILSWLQNDSQFFPQNNEEKYNALLIQHYNIRALDEIYCAPPYFDTMPRLAINDTFADLPLSTEITYSDECHRLSKLSLPQSPHLGILGFQFKNVGTARLFPSKYDATAIKFVDDAKMTYINFTDKSQVINVKMNVATPDALVIAVAIDDKIEFKKPLVGSDKQQKIEFSFSSLPNDEHLLDFVIEKAEGGRLKKNKSDKGLQITEITYSIQ